MLQSSELDCASLICCLVFLDERRIRDRDRGLALLSPPNPSDVLLAAK